MIGDAATVVGITKFLVNDFGQLPAVVVVTDEPPEEARASIVGELTGLEYGDPPAVVFAPDQWSVYQAVRQAAPSFILGSSLDKDLAVELGVQHQTISFPATDRLVLNRGYAGYRGSVTLVEDFVAPGLVAL